ncbi:Tim10/DDP family zinc finger-domain-containing protein [Mrakia frigida]|uniref:protein transporter TIM8 n=1 Tax=Mrakia frigida TaxID=29902 RepID=UPI003FCC2550
MSAVSGLGFDEATQKELTTFLENEQAKAKLQQSIHTFTSMCWDKCMTGTISSRFARNEESCLVNCTDRFLDTSLLIVNTIEKQRSQQ